MFNRATMSTLKDRLEEFMAETGWDEAKIRDTVADVVSRSAVSQWLGKSSKIIHTIGNMEAAIYLERASGYSALWLAKGVGPKLAKAPSAALSAVLEPVSPIAAKEPIRPFQVWPLSPRLMERLRACSPDDLARIEAVVDTMLQSSESLRAGNRAAS